MTWWWRRNKHWQLFQLTWGWLRLRWRSAPVGQEFQLKTKLFEAMVGMADMISNSSWGSSEAKFLFWVFEVVQESWPLENSLSKKCILVDNYVIFLFMFEILHQSSLGRSVNPSWGRNHFVTNCIALFPYFFWPVHFCMYGPLYQ